MVYRIYKVINQEIKLGDDNYRQRVILEEIDEPNMQMDWNAMEGAISEIAENSENLKETLLTILPIIYVNYYGGISDNS